MNLNIKHTYGSLKKIYNYTTITEWIEDIRNCFKKNELPENGFLPQEVYIHNIERIFNNTHRIFICGHRTDEYEKVMKWLETLPKEELSLFDLYQIDLDEEEGVLHFYFKVY